MSDIADEAAAWLQMDLPGEIENMINIAAVAQRQRPWSTDRDKILVLSSACNWPIGQHVSETTPAQLRALADEHDRAAAELLDDALELREYADAIDYQTPLGNAISEHWQVMADEKHHRATRWAEESEIAGGPGGVLTWDAIDDQTQRKLRHAGLLTVDDVREAVSSDRLFDVDGVGPQRYRKILAALQSEVA
jgi:phosphoribosylanthranilate isomerase